MQIIYIPVQRQLSFFTERKTKIQCVCVFRVLLITRVLLSSCSCFLPKRKVFFKGYTLVDFTIHQVFLARKLLVIPHNLGGMWCKKWVFFWIKHLYYTPPPQVAYAKKFCGEGNEAWIKKRSVHNNNYLCPSVFVLFMSGNFFLAVLPG